MSTPYQDEPTTRSYGRQEHRGGWGGLEHQMRRGAKPFFLTSEFLTMVAVIAAIAIAAAVADNFDAPRAWTLITIAAGAYIVSRGLSKVGRGDSRGDD